MYREKNIGCVVFSTIFGLRGPLGSGNVSPKDKGRLMQSQFVILWGED